MITGQTISNTYQGDGTTRTFTFTFEFTDSSQIKFKVNGNEVTTNYSLNTANKTLTYPTVESELSPLTSADMIEIYRDTPITQDIEFSNGGPLNAEMIEEGLDKLTMIAQELKRPSVVVDADNTGLVIQANKIYRFTTPLTTLTITSAEVSDYESRIYFTTGDTISFTDNSSIKWGGGSAPTLTSNTIYCIAICNGLAEIDNFGITE